MDISGYRSDGVGLAVALVNGVYDPAVDESEAVDAALLRYGVINRPLSARERAAVRTWAEHLLNQLLDVVVTHPYITDHGGRLHLHYAPAEAAPLHRVQASTSMALAIVLCDYGMSRLGVCRAADCECVYVDVSRNAQRRFCSESCANRTNVAAFRARAKSAPAASREPAPSSR